MSDGLGYIWMASGASKEDQERWEELEALTEEEFIQVLQGNCLNKNRAVWRTFYCSCFNRRSSSEDKTPNQRTHYSFIHRYRGLRVLLNDIYKNIWWAAFISAGGFPVSISVLDVTADIQYH